MDYKDNLRELKENREWEKLLSTSLKLYKQNKKERYIVRMIVLAYEKLGNEEDAVPFWEILARGENKPEEFSRKLAHYYQKNGDKKNWSNWTKKLLFQLLRKKDFENLEDTWMQLLEAGAINKTFVFEVIDKVESLGESERAFTLLDLFLLFLEEKKPLPSDVLDIAKRMLEIDSNNTDLRKGIEGFYRAIYAECSEIENFLEKTNIVMAEDVEGAIDLLEKLLKLCPGRYVAHKSWGVGKIKSIDLLFNKVFVDFPARPGHSIGLELAFNILQPLEKDALPVLKIEKREYLLTLKKKKPAHLIKLMLRKKEAVSQEEVKTLLEGILKDDEWKDFINRVKKSAIYEGIEIMRKGNKYQFGLTSVSKGKQLSMEDIDSIIDLQERIKPLLSLQKENLNLEDKKKWIVYAEEIIMDRDVELHKRIELLFAQYDIIEDKKRLKERLDLLLKDMKESEKLAVINGLSQKRYKKELLQFIIEEDDRFAEKIFLKTTDDWLRNHSRKILEERGNVEELYLKALQNPYKNPSCFLYLLEIIMKGKEKKTLIEKPIIPFEALLELLGKKDMPQKIRARSRAIFSKFGYEIYKWVLETSSKEEIKVLLDIIKKEITIDSEDKKVFERLAEAKYPMLKEREVEEFFYVTGDAMKKKRKELDHLLKVEIPANSEAIGKAARQGDLSENFDYISAKEKQRRLIDRVNMLKDDLSKARPIEEIPYIEGQVGIGTKVMLEDIENGEKREILILGPWDSIPDKEVISHTAPLAAGLIGKKLGETFFDRYHKKDYKIVGVEKFSHRHR